MNPGCPNSGCIYFQKNTFCKKDGYYLRKDDSRQIQRYKCSACSKKFSRATGTLEFGQKKRRINKTIFKILSSGVSMRRSAIILGVHRTTIDRKLVYLAQ
ncbi:IS1 family transposase, partial [Bacteriovorax stolpii]